jgi:hypothetical protein
MIPPPMIDCLPYASSLGPFLLAVKYTKTNMVASDVATMVGIRHIRENGCPFDIRQRLQLSLFFHKRIEAIRDPILRRIPAATQAEANSLPLRITQSLNDAVAAKWGAPFIMPNIIYGGADGVNAGQVNAGQEDVNALDDN